MAIRFDEIELSASNHHYYPVLSHGGNGLKITTSTGNGDFGSGNSSYFHISTDRGTFYFNKPVTFNGNITSYSGSNTASFATYYDSNNTAYYVNPASTSVLYDAKDINDNGYVTYQMSGSDFANGTLVSTDIVSNTTNGDSFVIHVHGKSYAAEPPFAFKAQGYLYNNTMINCGGVSYGKNILTANQIKVLNDSNGKLAFWWPRVSYWNNFEVRVVASNSADGTRNRVTAIANATEPSSSKKVTITLSQAMLLGHNYGAGIAYASAFHDSNGTAYYLDPAATGTSLNVAGAGTFAGDVTISGSGDKIISAISSDDDATLFLSGAGSGKDTHIVYGNDRDLFISKSSSATATSEGTPVLTLGSNSNATFAGSISMNQSNTQVNMTGNSSGNFTIDNNTGNIAFQANGSTVNSMTITSSSITLNEIAQLNFAATINDDLTLNNSSPEIYFKTGSTHYNWMIAAQENVDTALEFTPANAVGASGTHSTPALTLYANRNAIFAGAVSIDGKLTLDAGSLTNGIINTPASLRINIDSNNNQTGEKFVVGHNQDSINNSNELFVVEETGNATFAGDVILDSDSTKLKVGNNQDLEIYHDGSNSRIQTNAASTGDLRINSQGSGHDLYLEATDDIFIRPQGGENGIKVIGNGQVELYHNSSKKFETSSTGVNVTGAMTASGDVVAYSDQRLKTDVKTLDGSKVYKMRGVSFIKDEKEGSGVIAQELEKVAPELVNNDSEYKSVAYGNITGYLIEAIKELKAEIEELKNK